MYNLYMNLPVAYDSSGQSSSFSPMNGNGSKFACNIIYLYVSTSEKTHIQI